MAEANVDSAQQSQDAQNLDNLTSLQQAGDQGAQAAPGGTADAQVNTSNPPQQNDPSLYNDNAGTNNNQQDFRAKGNDTNPDGTPFGNEGRTANNGATEDLGANNNLGDNTNAPNNGDAQPTATQQAQDAPGGNQGNQGNAGNQRGLPGAANAAANGANGGPGGEGSPAPANEPAPAPPAGPDAPQGNNEPIPTLLNEPPVDEPPADPIIPDPTPQEPTFDNLPSSELSGKSLTAIVVDESNLPKALLDNPLTATLDASVAFKGSYGLDGGGSFVYTLSLAANGTPSGLFTNDDVEILLNIVDGVVVGSAGGINYFTLSVDNTGSIKFTQLEPIAHIDNTNNDEASSLLVLSI